MMDNLLTGLYPSCGILNRAQVVEMSELKLHKCTSAVLQPDLGLYHFNYVLPLVPV
jgi:hypothetical protein